MPGGSGFAAKAAEEEYVRARVCYSLVHWRHDFMPLSGPADPPVLQPSLHPSCPTPAPSRQVALPLAGGAACLLSLLAGARPDDVVPAAISLLVFGFTCLAICWTARKQVPAAVRLLRMSADCMAANPALTRVAVALCVAALAAVAPLLWFFGEPCSHSIHVTCFVSCTALCLCLRHRLAASSAAPLLTPLCTCLAIVATPTPPHLPQTARCAAVRLWPTLHGLAAPPAATAMASRCPAASSCLTAGWWLMPSSRCPSSFCGP